MGKVRRTAILVNSLWVLEAKVILRRSFYCGVASCNAFPGVKAAGEASAPLNHYLA